MAEPFYWTAARFSAAGVEPRHVARLLGIHSVTASRWLCGHRVPSRLNLPRAALLAKAVEHALNDKALPIPDTMPPDERSVNTYSTLQKYLRDLEHEEGVSA